MKEMFSIRKEGKKYRAVAHLEDGDSPASHLYNTREECEKDLCAFHKKLVKYKFEVERTANKS